jgi:hypothetical protein
MRLYGKRFMANRTEGRIADRKESRDALVYDISEANRYCRVMVAGSSTLVRAWFPNNFMRAPQWLKVGIAVRIAHVGGDKSRIEVVSPGLIQPSQATIPMSGGANTILTGMYPTAPIDSTEWLVSISGGTYRINGASYIYSPEGALLGDDIPLGSDVLLGTTAVFAVDPLTHNDPDELWFRYDAFAIGADGVVDYIKGDEWQFTGHSLAGFPAGSPDKPAIASDHVLIRNYILIWTGVTSITQANIGKEYDEPRADHLDVSYGYQDPAFETDEDWARAQEGVGVIKGGAKTYVPASPGGIKRGSVANDMKATVTSRVMTQYGTPYSWWTDGSLNYLSYRRLGSASYDGYGSAGAIPDLTDESGYGEPDVVFLGLGNSSTIFYERKHTYIAQPNPALDGYPGYYQGDSDSHTAIFQVSLISSDSVNPVSNVISVYNLDSAGNPQ